MAIIKSMHLKGFKSFAKPLDLEFGTGFNCIIGPNGSGKCLKGDSLIQLADGQLVEIEKLVESKYKTNAIKKIDDGYIIGGDNTKVLCFDTETLKTKEVNVGAFVKRTAPKNLIQVKTRSGKEIVATEYHPLFTLTDKGIKALRADELKEGIKIAIPRNIPIKPKSTTFYELLNLIKPEDQIYVPFSDNYFKLIANYKKQNKLTWKAFAKKAKIKQNILKGLKDKQSINFSYLVKILRTIKLTKEEITDLITKIQSKNQNKSIPMVWKNSPELMRFLGYLLAEGRLTKSNQIWFTNGTQEIVEDYLNLTKKLFNFAPEIKEYKPNCYDIILYSKPLIKILEKFGMQQNKTTEHKDISNLILKNSSNPELSQLLNGLFCGDGYVSKSHVDIVTKSPKLAVKIQSILTRLNIKYTSNEIYKICTTTQFRGKYHSINIYGSNNLKTFQDNIYLIHNNKRKRLEELTNKKSNPNLDLIEANNLIKNVCKDLKIKIKPLRKEFPTLDSYCYNQCTPSREGINNLITNLFTKQSQKSQQLTQLQTLATSSIYWDEIVEITTLADHNEKWVYDLSIPKHHNFIANNVFVHNSNIMDALCFVLGKLSAKSMRAEKSSNLIFNGGKKGSALKEAEVSIIFTNNDDEFPVEGDELKLTRVIKSKGNSVYKINDQVMTRQQILELLAKGKVDPDGHNIVLQGDIVRFMEMRANDRKDLIQDIAGISVFEDKKNKAMNSLNRVEIQLNDATLILKERESYLKELKKDKDQAEKYKNLEKNIKSNKATYLNLQIKGKETKLEEVLSKIKKQESQIAKLDEKEKEIREKIALKKTDLSSINTEIENKGEKEAIALQEEVEKLKTNIATNEERFSTCKNEIAKLKERKKQLLTSSEDTKKTINGLEESKTQLGKEILILKEKEGKQSITINKIKNSLGLTENTELVDLEENLDDKLKQYEVLQQKNQELLQQKFRIDAEISSINEKISSIQELEKSSDIKRIKEELRRTTKELTNRLNEDTAIASQYKRAKEDYARLNEELFKLQTQKSNLRASSSADLAIKRIKDLNNPGVFGTVAELGEVDKKFSTALEVAAGGRIKSLVVRDDKVAAQCIQTLKASRAGIATFLPMNKIKKRPITRISGNGVHGPAINLITFDPKFKDIFSFVFGSTTVVENIQTARKVGIGKARMVTLEGDLVEISGAMVGGYRTKRVGMGFQEKSLSNNLEKITERIDRAGKLRELLENRKLENENKISELRNIKSQVEAELIKYERSTAGMSTTQLEKDKEVLELNPVYSEFSEIGKEMNILNNEIQSLKIAKDKLKRDSNQQQNLSELEQHESRRLKTREEIVQKNTEIKNIEIQIQKIYNPEAEKIILLINNCDKEGEEFNSETKNLEDLLKSQKSTLKIKAGEKSKFQKAYHDLFASRNKLSEAIQKLESSILLEATKEKTIRDRINEHSITKAKITAEVDALTGEFEEFKDAPLRRGLSIDDLRAEIRNFESMLVKIGNVNLRALEVYEEIRKEYETLVGKKDTLTEERDHVLDMIAEIETNKKAVFMKTFKELNKNFSRIFLSLSKKGEAAMELENKEDPLSAGVDIRVRIAGNKFLDIKSLSGGEKTMAALAFIFAIQEYQPMAFYLFDEVDAALDKKNSELLSELVSKYSGTAQYIMISHNDNVITEADYVYGVSMHETGISKVVSLKL